ncbi:Lsr2 family DNA-binding protein [Micromonospora okii]|uniref:Lsr2 family DNA-binding protein n=1 Tax=Micromonospora okii TaxID=1182970 RepID=UPI001E2954ED|nr:histone-like nucleoid-structuring protein Lsr2 [Micromonospora okii]
MTDIYTSTETPLPGTSALSETTAETTAEAPASNAASAADVRAWARSQGRTDVGDRGRLSRTVKEEFTKATGRPVA